MRYDVGRLSIAAVWPSFGIMTESQNVAEIRVTRTGGPQHVFAVRTLVL